MAQFRDVYKEVTNRVLTLMEKCDGKWQRPWTVKGGGMPMSVRSRKPYRGINFLLLSFSGYASPEWGTYRAWQEKGAQVRKGEKGTTIIFWKPVVKTEVVDGKDVDAKFLVARAYTVFNAEQVDGYEREVEATSTAPEGFDHVEAYITKAGVDIVHRGDRAYYSRKADLVVLPPVSRFKAVGEASATETYYATKLHEVLHWTGGEKRLNRDLKKYSEHAYAFEELVAEMGAAFLCARLRVSPVVREDHAQYMRSWLEVMRGDSHAIFQAASLAQKACDFLDEAQGETVASEESEGEEQAMERAA